MKLGIVLNLIMLTILMDVSQSRPKVTSRKNRNVRRKIADAGLNGDFMEQLPLKDEGEPPAFPDENAPNAESDTMIPNCLEGQSDMQNIPQNGEPTSDDLPNPEEDPNSDIPQMEDQPLRKGPVYPTDSLGLTHLTLGQLSAACAESSSKTCTNLQSLKEKLQRLHDIAKSKDTQTFSDLPETPEHGTPEDNPEEEPIDGLESMEPNIDVEGGMNMGPSGSMETDESAGINNLTNPEMPMQIPEDEMPMQLPEDEMPMQLPEDEMPMQLPEDEMPMQLPEDEMPMQLPEDEIPMQLPEDKMSMQLPEEEIPLQGGSEDISNAVDSISDGTPEPDLLTAPESLAEPGTFVSEPDSTARPLDSGVAEFEMPVDDKDSMVDKPEIPETFDLMNQNPRTNVDNPEPENNPNGPDAKTVTETDPLYPTYPEEPIYPDFLNPVPDGNKIGMDLQEFMGLNPGSAVDGPFLADGSLNPAYFESFPNPKSFREKWIKAHRKNQ